MKSIHDAQFLTFVLHRTWRAWVGCFLGVLHFHHLVRHRSSGCRSRTCVSSRLLASDHYSNEAKCPQAINDLLAVYLHSVTFPGPGDLCREYVM